MIHSAVVAVALLSTAITLSAQSAPPLRAFPRSTGFSFGLASFSKRSESDFGGRFSYKGSLIVGGRFDQPLSRRTGLLIALGVAPLSQQRGQGEGSTVLSDKLMVAIADAAIGWRFKPIAPVFFSAGGGLTYATKPSAAVATGSVAEPHALFAIGYDSPSKSRWNIRTVLSNRLVFVGADSDSTTNEEAVAYDWTLEIGGRYRLPQR